MLPQIDRPIRVKMGRVANRKVMILWTLVRFISFRLRSTSSWRRDSVLAMAVICYVAI